MTAVGTVSSIAFWIAVVMSLVTWSKLLDLMCWLLGSPLWSAGVNILMSTSLYFLRTTLGGSVVRYSRVVAIGSDLKHSLDIVDSTISNHNLASRSSPHEVDCASLITSYV